jgi:hypothetical protein
MLVVSRSALLLTGPAYASDTSTQLSAAEMTTELKAVSAASARAAAGGWKATVKVTADSVSGSQFFAVDPVARVAYERYEFSGVSFAEYVQAGKGTYAALTDPMSRAAVRMMGRPSVRYVFTADKSTKLDIEDGEGGVSPGTLLAGDVDHAGTKTVHDDGSTDYRISEDATTMTAHVTAAGALVSTTFGDEDGHATLSYGYGPQQVTLPSASVTIGAAALARGLAYLDMASIVREVAGEAATDTLQAAHGHQISVSLLREVTRDDADGANAGTGVKLVRTKTVSGGVRVYATNPWTHGTVAYTLQPSGRKVTIAKN